MRKKSVKREKAIDFFEIPETEKSGVYAIVNFEDFRCYVGSTGNIKRRATAHKSALISGNHTNKYLQDAANDNKILRFVILKEFEEQPQKDVLLLLEYCYMLQMEVKCFELYNIQPQGHYNRKNKYDALVETIANSIVGMIKAAPNIENAMYKTYGTNTGYMLNTQYREYWAKKEIGLDTKPTTTRRKNIDTAITEKEDIFTLFNAKKAEYEANKQQEKQTPRKDSFAATLERLRKDNQDGKLALNVREDI